MIQAQMSQDGSASKKLVLVMNKIDLVPTEEVSSWVKHLRREFPTIAFKASTQQQKGNLAQSQGKFQQEQAGKDVNNKSVDMAGSVGAGALLQLLKNYSRTLNMKKSIVVGVIGFPNVGKSSIINSLKRSRAVGVSSTPGFTKALQQVKLDKQISIIDSPGVIFTSGPETDAGLFLRNCVRVEQIEDAQGAVGKIVERCNKEALMEIYKIASFDSNDEFLFHVAHARGKMGKGGVPNLTLAARSIIQDWNDGKIPFYTPAPVTDIAELNSEVVTGFSEEFDIGALLRQNDDEMAVSVEKDRDQQHRKFLKIAAQEAVEGGAPTGMEDEDEDEEEDVAPAPVKVNIQMKKVRKGKKGDDDEDSGMSSLKATDSLNLQRNKDSKKAQKKASKERRRKMSTMNDEPFQFGEFE